MNKCKCTIESIATGVGQTLRVHSPGGSIFLYKMTSWPPSWNYDVLSEIR